VTNDFTLESARNLDNAQLLQAIADGLQGAADSLHKACVAVAVAQERGITLPKLPQVFDYAKQIAEGALSPRAAMTLCRFPFVVAAVRGFPHELQESLADGMKVKIAVMVNGRVQSAERTIWEMSAIQMRTAFDDGKIVPWDRQGEWLIKSGYVEPAQAKPEKAPRFDRVTGQIVDGKKRRNIDDYRQAFAEAGFKIEPIYKQSRRTSIA